MTGRSVWPERSVRALSFSKILAFLYTNLASWLLILICADSWLFWADNSFMKFLHVKKIVQIEIFIKYFRLKNILTSTNVFGGNLIGTFRQCSVVVGVAQIREIHMQFKKNRVTPLPIFFFAVTHHLGFFVWLEWSHCLWVCSKRKKEGQNIWPISVLMAKLYT